MSSAALPSEAVRRENVGGAKLSDAAFLTRHQRDVTLFATVLPSGEMNGQR
jgi:hypothetical protein